MTVDSKDYMDKLVDYGMVKIYALASVQETKQTWSEEDDFQFDKPPLKISVRDLLVVRLDQNVI